jgi:hypothetical protein
LTDKFSYDSDGRYPEDPIGRELGENARVWRYYRDEAAKFDQERVSRWNDIIDVLLVFVGGLLNIFVIEAEFLIGSTVFGHLNGVSRPDIRNSQP